MRVVIADLKGRDGFVNKDTIVGGYGARFRGFSWTTRLIERVRKIYQNVPSIHCAYLAAIFESAGHEVVFTDEQLVDGDLGLVLTSIVDYRHEIRWAEEARRRSGMRVGFFGAMATHVTQELQNHADFVIKGEPEAAALRLAQGEKTTGILNSPSISNLDTLPFPAWHLLAHKRTAHAVGRSLLPSRSAFPVLSSRSCPEFCTYCPHRITAPYRARSAENVVAEIEELCGRYGRPYLIFRDPLFTEERERSVAIAEGIIRKNLPVQFECETRLDNLDTDLVNLLCKAGLHTITFGVESVDPATLKRVGRRPIPPAHQKAIVEHCRELGVQTQGFYVFGFPNETAESIRATINYAIQLGSTTAMFKVLTPYPGTPLYKQISSRIFETDLEKFDGYTLTFNHPSLDADQMRFLLGSAYARFYVRPTWAWNYLGFRGFRKWFERMDDYTSRKQLANEMAFFGSQNSDGRIE
jgi:radical SAM superfamily enzyme YgiQ (UPF0313 family)